MFETGIKVIDLIEPYLKGARSASSAAPASGRRSSSGAHPQHRLKHGRRSRCSDGVGERPARERPVARLPGERRHRGRRPVEVPRRTGVRTDDRAPLRARLARRAVRRYQEPSRPEYFYSTSQSSSRSTQSSLHAGRASELGRCVGKSMRRHVGYQPTSRPRWRACGTDSPPSEGSVPSVQKKSTVPATTPSRLPCHDVRADLDATLQPVARESSSGAYTRPWTPAGSTSRILTARGR